MLPIDEMESCRSCYNRLAHATLINNYIVRQLGKLNAEGRARGQVLHFEVANGKDAARVRNSLL